MRSHYFKTLKTAILAISVLLLGVSVSFAQQTVNLTAAPTSVTLPDGSLVPMWGYTCLHCHGHCGHRWNAGLQLSESFDRLGPSGDYGTQRAGS